MLAVYLCLCLLAAFGLHPFAILIPNAAPSGIPGYSCGALAAACACLQALVIVLQTAVLLMESDCVWCPGVGGGSSVIYWQSGQCSQPMFMNG